MLSSTIKNISTSLLSLLIISFLIFFLSKTVPGDTVIGLLDISSDSELSIDFKKEYKRKALELNFDKPLFYFSVLPSNFPKNLNETIQKEQRDLERKLLFEGYKYERIQSYQLRIEEILTAEGNEVLNQNYRDGLLNEDEEIVNQSINSIKEDLRIRDRIYNQVTKARGELVEGRRSFYFPKFVFHGFQNQYHIWISNLLAGDLGISYIDKKEVSAKIGRALVWTTFLVLFSLSLSYLMGILIGVALVYIRNKSIVKLIERILFALYSIPIFWLATLLLVFFTTKEYGAWTNIFPSVGLTPIDLGEAWYVKIGSYGKQLVLPCFCLVVHNLAYIGSLTKRNVSASSKLGHVLTAKAYGFNAREILKRDVLPHSLLPIITSVSSSIPSAIGGSLVIEIIFNIPGMGRLLYASIQNYDWPVVFSVTMIIALITIGSFLIAELVYRLVDPRIRNS